MKTLSRFQMHAAVLVPMTLAAALGILSQVAMAAVPEIRVPAFTAYLEPKAEGARVSQRQGVTGWTDPSTSIHWFGEFQTNGMIRAAVELRLAGKAQSRLRLSLDGQSKEVTIHGNGTNLVIAEFGDYTIGPTVGFRRFSLQSLNAPGESAGDIVTLHLAGAALENAHFNLESRRNAASVHLAYPEAKGTNVAAFYCEVTAVEDPVHTFYMACGWHRGYFGMQVNSPTERRIIFSVWDSGQEAVDRKKVASENRVTLLGKGEGVYTGDFGNEGTGGHSHLKYLWKTGEQQRFLVTAQPTNGTATVFSGWYFHPDHRRWELISSWRAPKEGGWLRGLHSFSENFSGGNGQLRRLARYGNQWMLTDQGQWMELTTASFSHDPTGKTARRDRFMGVMDGDFFLSHGGFISGFTKFGDRFQRPRHEMRPADLMPLPVYSPARTDGPR